jgi:hypothetical protein
VTTISTTPDINEILARSENSGATKYGADMGRRNQCDGQGEKLHLQRLRWVDGDYDTGGAYWGDSRDGTSIYCAFSPDDTQNDPPIRIFVRAKNRDEAASKVLEEVNEGGFSFFDEFDLNEMVQDYVVAALWSTNDDDQEPLDRNHDHDEIEPESFARMTADCKAFVERVSVELPFVLELAQPGDLGNDFWFTRNHHGVGFWDGDWDWFDRDGIDVGRRLTDIAQKFKETNLYVGDDGKVHEGF